MQWLLLSQILEQSTRIPKKKIFFDISIPLINDYLVAIFSSKYNFIYFLNNRDDTKSGICPKLSRDEEPNCNEECQTDGDCSGNESSNSLSYWFRLPLNCMGIQESSVFFSSNSKGIYGFLRKVLQRADRKNSLVDFSKVARKLVNL